MIGLEKITEKIISDAELRAEEIIAEAEAKCKEIEEESKRKKEQIENTLEAEAVKEEEGIKMRAKSGIAKARRDKLLRLRADLIDKAFADAIDAIIHLDGEQYRGMLSSLMAKVLCDRVQSERDSLRLYGEDISPESYEIIMNKRDRDNHARAIMEGARRATVGKLPPEVASRMVLSDKISSIEGGFIIKCGDIELNCSVRTIVAGIRPALEAKVEEILFGETGKQN